MPARKYNKYTINGDVATIELTRGKTTTVNTEHLSRIIDLCAWYAYFDKRYGRWEARGKYTSGSKTRTYVKLHRFILEVTNPEIIVDHKDGNPLNNLDNNIRVVTAKQNSENIQTANVKSRTGIRGVCFYQARGARGIYYTYYRAGVKHNKKIIAKNFPYTPQGLIDAEQWVIAKRLELFTHSDGR